LKTNKTGTVTFMKKNLENKASGRIQSRPASMTLENKGKRAYEKMKVRGALSEGESSGAPKGGGVRRFCS